MFTTADRVNGILRTRKTIWLNQSERRRLKRLAAKFRASESAVVRMLMLKADAEQAGGRG